MPLDPPKKRPEEKLIEVADEFAKAHDLDPLEVMAMMVDLAWVRRGLANLELERSRKAAPWN